MGRSLRVSQQQTHHLWSKMGLKLGSALLLFLPLLSLALANADVEDDSKQDLANQVDAIHVAANQAGHELVKREAGRGRKSCERKRCSKKKTTQKVKKGEKGNKKPKNSEKKRKSLRRKQSQRQKKKKDETKKKSGKKSKKRKGGKKKESQK